MSISNRNSPTGNWQFYFVRREKFYFVPFRYISSSKCYALVSTTTKCSNMVLYWGSMMRSVGNSAITKTNELPVASCTGASIPYGSRTILCCRRRSDFVHLPRRLYSKILWVRCEEWRKSDTNFYYRAKAGAQFSRYIHPVHKVDCAGLMRISRSYLGRAFQSRRSTWHRSVIDPSHTRV